MTLLSRPVRLCLITAGLIIFDIVLLYLFLNQPIAPATGQESWDFRHAELRRIEQQLAPIEETTPSAELLRPQSEADSQGKVL